ncbi:RING-type domain-containing protein [Mycena venus]|uniref:RING-type domain-containing protein n=1 Tax=Mycena venus TaxID=2733690 RepID=A0A8H6Y6J9_9AGAR|nr:RING-type domain-containing protein [Mycena venus]
MADQLRALFESTSTDPNSLHIRERIAQIVSDTIARGENPGANLSQSSRVGRSSTASPRLTEAEIRDQDHHDSLCPICFTPFAAILAEEETALAMDSPAYPADELGVTKLAASWQCGHLFCRRDISKWIRGGHGSCPMCRRSLVESPSNSSSEPSGTAEEPTTSPADAELLNQIRTFMEELHSNGAVAYVDHDGDFAGFGGPIYVPEGGYNDDRSEFSGMYS